MLSGGLRLALLVAAPLLGALVVHEVRGRWRAQLLVALGAIATGAGLTMSLVAGVSGGAAVERTFGTAIPGVDLTLRADSASIAVILIAAGAAVLGLRRALAERDGTTGLMLCLAGAATVAVAGNLVLLAAGVEVIAGGTLLLGGRRLPGLRATALVSTAIAAAAVALVASAAQLVAGAGSSDLAAIPPGAVGGAVAVPWALAGALLLISPLLVNTPRPGRDWAPVGAIPAGYLVLLRLQQTAGGQAPGNAGLMLGVIGAIVAIGGARAALRATTVGDAGRAATAVLAGLLVSLFGGDFAGGGVTEAGLFVGIELAAVASAPWGRRPSGWGVVVAGLVALPGGATMAVVLVSFGSVVGRGPASFPQLAVLATAVVAAAVGVGRHIAAPPQDWRTPSTGTLLGVAAGLVGGLLPGLALRTVAAPFAAGAQRIDVDAGALQQAGAGWAGGYLVAALLLVLGAGTSALLIGDGAALTRPLPLPETTGPWHVGGLLRLRRRAHRIQLRALATVRSVDHWLDVQPTLALVGLAAVVGILVFH